MSLLSIADLSCDTGCTASAGSTEAKTSHAMDSALSVPESVCSHRGLCLAPHNTEHSSAFWHMASLEAGLGLCSFAAASAQQLPTNHTGQHAFSFLDLSSTDTGAAEYLLKRAPVKVQSAVIMSSEAAQQLCSSQAAATDGEDPAQLQQWPSDFNPAVATPSAHAASSSQAAAGGMTPLSHTGDISPSHAAGSMQQAQLCSTTPAADSAESTAGQSLSQHSLASYQTLTAAVGQFNLVVGDLCSLSEQQSCMGASRSAGSDSSSAEVMGVMETEYSSAYRARLLWECAVALACLKPGELPPVNLLRVPCSCCFPLPLQAHIPGVLALCVIYNSQSESKSQHQHPASK